MEQVVRGRVDAGELSVQVIAYGFVVSTPIYQLLNVLTTCYHKMRLPRKTALHRTMDISHVRTHDQFILVFSILLLIIVVRLDYYDFMCILYNLKKFKHKNLGDNCLSGTPAGRQEPLFRDCPRPFRDG